MKISYVLDENYYIKNCGVNCTIEGGKQIEIEYLDRCVAAYKENENGELILDEEKKAMILGQT